AFLLARSRLGFNEDRALDRILGVRRLAGSDAAPCRAILVAFRSARAPARYDSSDSRARSDRAPNRARRHRRARWRRAVVGGLHGRRGALANRQGRCDVASPVSNQTRGNRLRLFDPDLFRGKRRAVWPWLAFRFAPRPAQG